MIKNIAFIFVPLVSTFVSACSRAGLTGLVLLLALWMPALSHAGAGKGYLESARYNASTQVLSLTGWAAPESPNVYTSNAVVMVGGRQVYRGRFVRVERPDVVSATHRPDWLSSGWRLDFKSSDLPPGQQSVQVRFVLTDGQTFDVHVESSSESFVVPTRSVPSRSARLLVALAILLPCLCFVWPDQMRRCVRWRCRAETLFAISLTSSFLCLVLSGFSGSSLRLAMLESPILSSDPVPWLGEARPIRLDEWRILTQMAIGQFNAVPRFPLVNSNVGTDGNNMLIIGMTGVPVSHISSLAKPATWGFWLFNLRSALSWDWWFPFFGCFLALWGLLLSLFRLGWRSAAVLSLGVTASPYSVVFSGHPAYLVFFLALCALALDRLLKTEHSVKAQALGALAGLSLVGFVLVLYLPWQITLLYLAVPLMAAHWATERNRLIFQRPQMLALSTAALVFLILMGSWLVDTQATLRIIAATVYPGQRATSVGGDIDRWFMIKGLTNPLTLYHDSDMFFGASDAGSFIWLWIPLVALTLIIFWQTRKLYAVPAVILGFMLFTFAYMYIGFSIPLAKATLWARVMAGRLDLALGVAQSFLLAWLIVIEAPSLRAQSPSRLQVWIAQGIALLSIVLTMWQMSLLPTSIANLLTPGFVVLVSTLMGFVAYLVLMRRHELAMSIGCVYMVGSGIMFNPLDQAPSQVQLNAELKAAIHADGLGTTPRLAVLNESQWGMNLVAAGIPTVNAVLYHPQTSLWRNLDPEGAYKTQYNRYQHLNFVTRNLSENKTFQIDAPNLDQVRVSLDPVRFDFNQLGASHVLTTPEYAHAMAPNPSLHIVIKSDKWALLKVNSR